MSTATAEPQTETVVFQSRCPNQVLTRRKTRYVFNQVGEKEVLGEEEWQERQRELNERRIENGEDPIPFDESPWKIQFENSRYETSDPRIIEYLRTHRWNGYNGASGFYELQKPLDEREPTKAEQMREVQQASLHHDLTRAEACLQVEQETHRRPEVLQAAEAAVADLRELLGASSVSGADSGNGAPPSTSSS